jgi:hypothetical protein
MDHDWKRYPLRFDPRRGYRLCEPCWNGQHWNKPYRDKDGVHHPKTSNCLVSVFKGVKDGCGCGCLDPGPKKVKLTGSGQERLFNDPKTEQTRHQDE